MKVEMTFEEYKHVAATLAATLIVEARNFLDAEDLLALLVASRAAVKKAGERLGLNMNEYQLFETEERPELME
jgi:hypothetical protein